MWTSIERATNVASQPMAIESGCKGLSITPISAVLFFCFSGVVGEYCPFVKP
jgi:hypothetical protein